MLQNKLLAGGGQWTWDMNINNPLLGNLNAVDGATFFQTFIPRLISLALIIGAVIFFFTLIMGGIQWISSGGDKQSLEEAKSKVTNAIVGLVIMLAIFAIINLIQYFFHISILTIDIGSLVIQ